MVKARTTTSYINENTEIHGSALENYVQHLKEQGKSDHAVDKIRKYIRAFLNRCPPRPPEEITAEVMADVDVVMENDNLSPLYRKETLLHTGKFLEYVTGTNPFREIDPDTAKPNWFDGHLGTFRFGDQLKAYLDYLETRGMSPESIRRKRIHCTICSRILDRDKRILFLSQIDESCYWYLGELMKDLGKETSDRILFDFDGFVKFSCQSTHLKSYRKRKGPVKELENTPEWADFMNLLDSYRADMEERGFREKTISSFHYSASEGYQAICERFGPMYAKDINYHHIRELRKCLKDLKQITIRHYLSNLGKLLEFHFGVNPYRTAGLLWSPETTQRTWIFKAQWKLIWDSADTTERLVLALGGGMGLRRSEIAELKLADIGERTMTVRGKGHNCGKIVEKEIPPSVRKAIESYLEVRNGILSEFGDHSDGNLLVMDTIRRGAPASVRFVETVLQRLSSRTMVELSCHTLRRFYCMALVDAGTDMDTVRRMMRHENVETTFQCYVRADPRKLSAATATVEDAIFC